MQVFPHVSEELLRALKEAFPDRLPVGDFSMEYIHRLVGNQQIIAFLEMKHQDQTEQMLHGGVI